MIRINNISLGLPPMIGTKLLVRPIINSTTDTSCIVYYEVCSSNGQILASGNLQITEEQYTEWSDDNCFIENVVLTTLGLTRDLSPEIIENTEQIV